MHLFSICVLVAVIVIPTVAFFVQSKRSQVRHTFDESTGTVDAVTGAAVFRHTTTGALYAKVPASRWLRGMLLDVVIFLASWGVTSWAVISMAPQITADTWALTAVIVTLWFSCSAMSGMIRGTVGSIGDQVAGFHLARRTDGTRPGPWAGALRAIIWAAAPVYVLLLIASFFDPTHGYGEFSLPPIRYTTVDLRSGVSTGKPPVDKSSDSERPNPEL